MAKDGNGGEAGDQNLMKANVSGFLKDPSGHTVYQVDVQLPYTRQVWSVFKRYQEFVDLRQELKQVSKRRAQYQQNQLQQAPRSPGRTSPSKRARKGGAGASSPPSVHGKAAGPRIMSGKLSMKEGMAGARGFGKVLAAHRFPSKLSFTGTAALNDERKRALNAFLMALAEIRPLPHALAAFVGLLQDNRLGLDKNGNYVQVENVDVVLPIPPSPGHRNRQDEQTGKGRFFTGSERSPRVFGTRSLSPPKSAADPARPSGNSPSGRSERGSRRDFLIRSRPLREVRAGMGASPWAGVPREDALSPRRPEDEWSTDTDVPTEDSDGEPEGRTESDVAGDNRLFQAGQLTEAEEAEFIRGGKPKGNGGLAKSMRGNLNSFDFARMQISAQDGAAQQERTKVGGTGVRWNAPAHHIRSSARKRGGRSTERKPTSKPEVVARLKGGGGGRDPSEGGDGEDEKGLYFILPEEGEIARTGAKAPVASAAENIGKEGSRGDGDSALNASEEKREGMNDEQLDRMLQREFVNGFFDKVVEIVIRRRELDVGVNMEERKKTFPLSSEDRELRMAELMSLGVDLPHNKLLALLSYKDWGPHPATALYQDLIATGKGSLEKVTPGAAVRGMENGGNTCYIDSLLFAMFATIDAFDWLLLKTLPASDPLEVKLLQKHLRFLVNQVRRGAVVPREHSNLIREQFRNCGWQGGSSSQEDVSELFTFLVTLLRCPALPLSEALFHGGKSDASDSRVSTERALFLALPEEDENDRFSPSKSLPSTPAARRGASPGPRTPGSRQGGVVSSWKTITSSGNTEDAAGSGGGGGGAGRDRESGSLRTVTLEQILMHNFHDNRVEGLQRTVSGEKGSQPVDAWRMVSMLPFYALSGEHAGDSDPSNDLHFDTVMLPMVLKRYEATSASPVIGRTRKSQREVMVPLRLDCSRFMTPAHGGKGDTGDHGRFVLMLRSAVCHLGGESVNKGHYVAYAADRYRNRHTTGMESVLKASTGSTNHSSGDTSVRNGSATGAQGSVSKGGTPRGKTAASMREGFGDSNESVAWLKLDDLKRSPSGNGFVERVEGIHDAYRVFSEDLGLHSYMLFYELVALNLDHVGKAQIEEACSLIMTQQDYEFALRLDMNEKQRAALTEGTKPTDACIIS